MIGYLAKMRHYEGLRETPGPVHNSTIMGWIKRLGFSWLGGGDETPWCGTGLAGCMVESGFEPPKDAFRAASYLKWGTPTTTLSEGTVVVLKRPGGHHVTVAVAVSPGGSHFCGLGANQGNSIKESWFSTEHIVGMRNPVGHALPACPVRKIGASSSMS